MIVQGHSTGADVTRVVEKLLPQVQGETMATVAAAMLSIIICSLKPDVEEDELIRTITATSAFISTSLMPTGVVN